MPEADPHPRFVKLVRSKIARHLGSSEVVYAQASHDDFIEGLRAKLIEEAVEYLQNPSLGELADVYEVVRALALHDLEVPYGAVVTEAEQKAEDRGDFSDGQAMFVFSTATARHEGRRAA